MIDYMKEAERLVEEYGGACCIHFRVAALEPGNEDHRSDKDAARSALLAHIQRGAVPEGERAAFESWIENEAGAGAARRWLNTEAYENGRVQDYRTGWIACLEWLAAPAPDHFRDTAKMVPAPAEVPMPKPVAYGFGNTAITGHTNRLMMVRIDIPGDDQYAGAFWLPLVLADEAHTYGIACRAAGEAAGYARGLREMRDCREREARMRGALRNLLALDVDHQRGADDEDVCAEVREARAALAEVAQG